MTINDLTEGLRASQCFDIGSVAYAIVETNGNISVLLKSSSLPVCNRDMNIKIEESSLSLVLINDGKIINENLENLGLDNYFLDRFLKKEKISDIKNILILTINSHGEIFFQEKNQKYKIIKTELELNLR